jgi:hypothetical protein
MIAPNVGADLCALPHKMPIYAGQTHRSAPTLDQFLAITRQKKI